MQDRPTASELLEAVAAFISEEAVPALEGAKRFHALVAANVVRIVAREKELAPAQLAAECRRLWRLLDKPGEPPDTSDAYALALELNRELCELIEAGKADTGEQRERVLDYLKQNVAAKLAIDNPKLVE